MGWELAVEYALRLLIAAAVLMQRGLAPPARVAWLAVGFAFPWVGAPAYLLLGRARLGELRRRRYRKICQAIGATELRRNAAHSTPLPVPAEHAKVAVLAEHVGGNPVRAGNRLDLFGESPAFHAALERDLDAAREQAHLLFYIWLDDLAGRRIGAALARAAARGVRCRVLLDGVGSRPFLRSRACADLRAAGVQVVEALPARLWRLPFARLDLRNHRKIVVIDGAISYTGSQNMVAPDFKPGLRYSELMIRATGPVALQLQALFAADWFVESGDYVGDAAFPEPALAGSVNAQILPSGPSSATQRAQRMVVNLIYAARREVILTTPYFIPDQPLQEALETAAQRGVDVHVIVDHQVDQILVGNAQRSYYESLLTAGVRIHAYEEAFLHTKAISIDRMLAWVGSANFDRRSFQLNEEVIALIYDAGIAGELVAIQQRYMQGSAQIDLDAWSRRPFGRVLLENLARLVSPLL